MFIQCSRAIRDKPSNRGRVFVDYYENSHHVLQKALAGDNQAWDELFSFLWPVAAGVAASVIKGIGGMAMAEDIAQNVFVRLTEENARRLRLFDPAKGKLEPYIARIAHTAAVDYLRSNAKHFRNTDISSLPDIILNESDPLPMLEEWEMTAAFATLTPREKQVIELLYKKHLSSMEAAEQLKVNPDTIRSEKSHALKKLKIFFGQT